MTENRACNSGRNKRTPLSFQRMSTVANKSNRQVKDLAKPMECRTLKSGMGAPTPMPRGISTSNGSVADEYGRSKKLVMHSTIWLLRDLPLTAWAFVNPSFHTGSQSSTVLPCAGASGTVSVQVGRSQDGVHSTHSSQDTLQHLFEDIRLVAEHTGEVCRHANSILDLGIPRAPKLLLIPCLCLGDEALLVLLEQGHGKMRPEMCCKLSFSTWISAQSLLRT